MQKCCSRLVQQRIAGYRKRVRMERANNQGMTVQQAAERRAEPLVRRASRTGGAGTTRDFVQEMEPKTRHLPDALPPPREPTTRRSTKGSNAAGVGWGMIGALLVLLFITGAVIPWVVGIQHRWDCGAGNVCVTQVSLFRHGQVDTVLSFDASGSVDVVIAPAGDMLRSKVYIIETAVAPGKYVSVAPVDITGNGRTDLFVSVEGDGFQHSLMNNGDGTFTIDGVQK